MAKKRRSSSAEKKKQEKWEKIFENLLKTLQKIAKERQIFRDRLISDSNIYKEKISQLESEITTLEMTQRVDLLKTDMLVGLKHRDVFVYKTKFDTTVDDLKDLKAAFDCITKETNVSHITALKSERDFVWNQYGNMERKLNEKLNLKKTELEEANTKIMGLLKDMEQLRSSNNEKDSVIQRLKSDIDKTEAASVKMSKELERLCSLNKENDNTIQKLKSDMDKIEAASMRKSEELELLRKSGNDSVTPSLRRCGVTLRMGEKSKGNGSRSKMVKIESSSSQVLEKGTRSSKRKAAVDTTSTSETPKLFTSSFRVPKLKNLSPRVD